MGKRLTDVLKGSAATGFFAGLAALTGQDLDPGSVLISLCDLAAGWLSGRTSGDILGLIGDFKLALIIYGLVGTVLLILSILYCGRWGVLVAACGYFGMVTLITGLRGGLSGAVPGLVLLGVGALAAVTLRDHAGRDMRKVMRAAGLPVKKKHRRI